MDTLKEMQDEYRTITRQIKDLDAEIRAGHGPAMRAADAELLRMRHQVDADRPFGHAITAVMEQWADADAAYNDTVAMIEHARAELDLLLATPDADELDIASARGQVTFYTGLLPAQPPSSQFQQALAEAQAARTAAAGGAKIVTERDILTARGDAERADLAARAALRQRRQALRRELERVDRDVAGAFAAAQTATSDTLEQLLETARSEVALLDVAGDVDPVHTPLLLPDTTLAGHDPHTAGRLKALAAQPYRLSIARADVTDRDTAAALYTLRNTANAVDRKVLWLAATDTSTAAARDAELADTVTTVSHAHQQLSEQQWALAARCHRRGRRPRRRRARAARRHRPPRRHRGRPCRHPHHRHPAAAPAPRRCNCSRTLCRGTPPSPPPPMPGPRILYWRRSRRSPGPTGWAAPTSATRGGSSSLNTTTPGVRSAPPNAVTSPRDGAARVPRSRTPTAVVVPGSATDRHECGSGGGLRRALTATMAP